MSQQLSSTEMAQSMSETRRRQKATVTGGESTLDDDSGYTRAFQTDDQKFMLWNLANRETCPRTQRPAFRLLGLFPDMESVMSHAEQVFAVDKSCSLHASTTHEWYTIPVDPNTPVCETQAKVNRNLLKHQNMLQAHATEFKTRHDALTAGRTPAMEQAKGAAEQVAREDRAREKRKQILEAAVDNEEETVAALKAEYEAEAAAEVKIQAGLVGEEGKQESKEEMEVEYVETPLVPPVDPERLHDNWEEEVAKLGSGPRPPAVSRVVEVRNQRYASLSVVRDYETAEEGDPVGDEPGVIVWAAFDTEEEALKYNKVVASKELRDHDLAVVSMYEWIYPHVMGSDKVDQLYRNEELNNIMKHARTASSRVRQFEDMCEREQIECPGMDIEPDLTEPAPRKWVPPLGSELEDHSLVRE